MKIIDFLSRKNVYEYYKIYRKTQWFSKSQMELYKLDKFKKLINHCYENVPFYRNYMQEKRISPDMIRSLDHIELFPIINKEIIKDNYSQFIPININKLRNVKTSQTGGTTGNILFKRTDANTRSSTWAAFKRFEDWMGIEPGDKSLILMGGHVIGKNLIDQSRKAIGRFLTNSIQFSPYDTSEKNIIDIIESLHSHNFVLIRSYSQFLFSLSKRIEKEGLSFNVKAITTTAEPLMPEHRELFTRLFNSQIFDQYGCGEIGGIAFECDHHQGLHVTEERVILEVNENHELILTDLDNFSMPYIRYWNADQVILDKNECLCGRKSQLIKKILGRTCDYIKGVNGEFLHWAYFWHLFFDSKISSKRDLKKFQVVQVNRHELLLRLVCDQLTDHEKNMLINSIRNRLGPVVVKFSFEQNIENSASGKYLPVVNKLL